MENISVPANTTVQASAVVPASIGVNTAVLASDSAKPEFTAESVLNDLKSASRTYLSFKNIPPGEYIVNSFSIVESGYGSRVRIDIADNFMFLPERYSKIITAEKIDALNLTQKVMVYGGKDSSHQNRLILDFRDSDAFINELLTFTMA